MTGDMIKLPSTALIHMTNHTQTNRSCLIHANHVLGQSIISKLTVTDPEKYFTNLNPGLYIVNINGEDYYFDLYIAIGAADQLRFRSIYNSYAMVGQDKYPIFLYKKEGDISNHKATLSDTVNDFLSMIVIDGKTINDTANKDIRSISKFKVNTDKDSINDTDIDDYIEILLKNNIKSLPNGIKDTFILNAEQQQHHFIYRIGRKILTGAEDWQFIEDHSNDDTYLFYLRDNNVKSEDSENNMICSHFDTRKGSYVVSKTVKNNCIGTGYGTNGMGFFLRIGKDKIEYDREDMTIPLKNWLMQELNSDHPFVVEYALQTFRYRTVLLDEYHVKTYYPKTFVTLSDNYDVSYFYKTLHNIRR